MLALWLALLLRLPEPTWAVTTAFVLSTPRFVGAIAEKTFLRIVGAVLGAITGFLITGSLEQSPFLFVTAVGAVVALTTAAYGGQFAPYGLRQWGYTTTLVATQGLWNPEASWSIGLARCTEICIGIVVTTTVQFVLWPRYARTEFLRGVREILSDIAADFSARAGQFLGARKGGKANSPGAKLARLREMIRLGCMESPFFHSKLAEVEEVVAAVGSLSNAVGTLEDSLSSDSILRDFLADPVEKLLREISLLLDALRIRPAEAAPLEMRLCELRKALQAYEAALENFRRSGLRDHLQAGDSLSHARFWGATHEMVRAAETLTRLLPALDSIEGGAFPSLRFRKPSLPPPEWWWAGLRGGLAVASALFLVNWFHPPGGDLLVVGTYLLTAFSPETNRKEGDLGVYSSVLWLTPFLAGWWIFLLLATPALVDYSAMNLVLGAMLFAIGWVSDTGKINSFQTLLGLLLVVGVVSLNAQQAVGFQSIVGITLGLLLAAVWSATWRRTFRPRLPQRELTQSLSWLHEVAAEVATGHTPPRPSLRARLALTLARCQEIVAILQGRKLSAAQTENWRIYLQNWLQLMGHLVPWASQSADLPETARAALQRCRQVLQARLLALSTETKAPAETASEAFIQAREEIHAMGWSVKETLAGLLWVARAEKTYRLAEELLRSRSTLGLEELPADTAL